jgi:glycosyltransferase involved in cell wall biosynthesis
MKVLLVDVNYKNSSTGKIVYDLAEQLEVDGHESLVCFGRGPKISSIRAIRIAPALEVYFHALMTRISGLTGFFSYLATKRLIKQIEKFKPDVVHLHELHGYYLNINTIVEFLKINSIPVVWTFHCEFMYTGKCGHAYTCEKWKTHCHKCPQVKEYPSSVYFDFTELMFNQKKKMFKDFSRLEIVTPSNWLANRVKQSFLKTKSVNVIYNGIDTDNIFFPRNSTELIEKYNLKNKKVILSVAPDIMDERKGGRWILELSKLYSEEYVFILIGVKDLMDSYPSNVIALARTDDQQELAEFYSAADLFLLTSEKETFSLVTAESLACGTPVVGFDSGAPSEVAPEGFGSFVPYGDILKLSQLITGFFDGNYYLNDAISCRDFAVKNYSNSEMYRKHSDLYKDLITNSEV